MPAALRVDPLPEGGFRLSGEVDLSNAGELRDLEAPDGDLLLEMSGLTFMDSTGLRGVIELARRLEPEGRLVLRNPSPAVDRLFEVTGVERIENLSIERS